jgi:transcription elongation GreA/GreB family factor
LRDRLVAGDRFSSHIEVKRRQTHSRSKGPGGIGREQKLKSEKDMSSAFIREQDDIVREDLADRPVSPHRNLVTPEGYAQIEAELARRQAEVERATRFDDLHGLALAQRELRYWTSRRGSAEVVQPIANKSQVRFGHHVTLKLANGARMSFRIVGEDEADPAKGLLPHVAPLAKALFGKSVGDTVEAVREGAEIVEIS